MLNVWCDDGQSIIVGVDEEREEGERKEDGKGKSNGRVCRRRRNGR